MIRKKRNFMISLVMRHSTEQDSREAATVLVLVVPAAQDLAVMAEQEALVSPDFHKDQMAAIRNTILMATWMIF